MPCPDPLSPTDMWKAVGDYIHALEVGTQRLRDENRRLAEANASLRLSVDNLHTLLAQRDPSAAHYQ